MPHEGTFIRPPPPHKYTVNVYVPTVLRIKCLQNIKYGPSHLLFEIKLVNKHCTEVEKVEIFKSITINAHFAHHEPILLSLLCSDKKERERQDICK